MEVKILISTSDFKTGLTIEFDNEIYTIVEFQHVKPGKGAAFVRTKLKNRRSGAIVEKTFRSGEKVEKAHIEKKEMQYLYSEGSDYYFMNTETYDQYEIPVATIQEELLYMLENSDVKIQFYGTEVIGVTVPTTVELVVAETQPSIKGATVTGSGKPATMETGLVVNVPDFIEAGQKLVINTAEGTYVSRA